MYNAEDVEAVARVVCRRFRLLQGFEGAPDYSLDDEVENAWDLFTGDARAILTLFRTELDEKVRQLVYLVAHGSAERPIGSNEWHARIDSLAYEIEGCWGAVPQEPDA